MLCIPQCCSCNWNLTELSRKDSYLTMIAGIFKPPKEEDISDCFFSFLGNIFPGKGQDTMT